MSIWHPGPWWGPSGPGSTPAHTWPDAAPGSASAPPAAATVLQPQPGAAQLAGGTVPATTAAPTLPPPLPESPHQAAIADAQPAPKRQRTRAPKAAT